MQYDIVIIGGGLVGSSLALALQQSDYRVAVVDAGSWQQSHNDTRILALSYSSQRILQGLGVWDQVTEHSTAIRQIHISELGGFGFCRLHHQELQVPALGYVLAADTLQQVIQQAVNTPQIYSQTTLLGLELHDDHAVVELDSEQTLTARLVIAADGGQSKVCELLKIPSQQRDYGQTAVIARVKSTQHHQNIAYERFTPTGPLAMLPLPDGECSLVWTVDDMQLETVLGWSEQEFLQHLQRRFGWRLGQLQSVSDRQHYPLRLRRVSAEQPQRVAVIGNAAHTLHPVAGQGFNLGLRDVASLVDVLLDAQSLDEPTLFDTYHQQQTPDQDRIAGLTDSLVKLFSNRLPPLTFARNLGLLGLDHMPLLKQQFMRQMVGLYGHPSRLLRGLPI